MTIDPQIHILRSPENDIFLAHAHDEASHHFIQLLLDTDWPGGEWERETWEGQAVFPLHKADVLVQMAKFEGITVIDGPECL